MNKTVTAILAEEYSIIAKPGEKINCPFCDHHSISIKPDDSLGKCFHPSCHKNIKQNLGGGGASSPESGASLHNGSGCTLVEYSKIKEIPLRFLNEIGITQMIYNSNPALRIPYLDQHGKEAAIRFRTAIKKTDNDDNRFKWKSGAKPILYGLWKLDNAKREGYVIIVEGESDTQTLWLHNIPAIGLPGADTWKEEWTRYFEEIPVIYIVIEPDCGGDAVLKWFSKSKLKDKIYLLNLGSFKDPSEIHISSDVNFSDSWKKIMDNAISFSERQLMIEENEKVDLWLRCSTIASDRSILKRFVRVYEQLGVVGESRNSQLLYLALTSRILDRPISIAVKGPSACGKSYVIEQVLKFFPESSYHALTAMSERSLAYSEEPISHRFLILFEATGMENDLTSYLIRSLLSEGRVRYETVDKAKGGLKARLIEREGPTGLIVTTTRLTLHPENETRIFSLSITDTPEQTRNIMQSIAEELNENVDLSEWVAFQEWMQISNKQVIIPYASDLANYLPTVHVRLRRDFTQVLNFIRVHAILHQVNREKDSEGRIIATLEDYQIIRELLNDYLSYGLQVTIPQSIRETVTAIKTLYTDCDEGVTIKEVSKQLNLDDSVVLRRIRKAERDGYIEKITLGKKRPMKYKPGVPMPEDMQILPEPEQLLNCNHAADFGDDEPPPPPDHDKKLEITPWAKHLKDSEALPMPSTKVGNTQS